MARDSIRDRLTRAWPVISKEVLNPGVLEEAGDEVASLARQDAPVVWLLGKVQAGKSSIVKALTGVDKVEIGQGFAACTERSYVYDFPQEAPVVRFLDTRGLGEVAYDASEDMAWCEAQAHLLLVAMRVADPEQEAIVGAVGDIRLRHPDWPVIVAQTCLHALYPPGAGHSLPYPFAASDVPADIPPDLRRALVSQRALFAKIGGAAPIRFVPIDFMFEEDGFEPSDYGLGALETTIRETASLGLLAAWHEEAGARRHTMARAAHPHIMGYASAAGAADIVPAVGMVAVPAVQAKMLHSLASIYGTSWDRKRLAEFAGALGLGAGARYAAGFLARQLAKLIPGYGQTVAATFAAVTSFATTFALGKAAGIYLWRRQIGEVLDAREISEAYAKALEEAFDLAKKRPWHAAKRADHGGAAEPGEQGE